MNLLSRLALVTLLVCAGFGALYWAIFSQGRSEIEGLIRDLAKERSARLTTATTIQGAGLEALVSSYAWWDDMVKFMDHPDETWAADNVDNIVGIPSGGDAVWIVGPELNLIHTVDKDYRRPAAPFASPAELRRLTEGRYTFRYFTRIDGALWEIYGAAIQDAKFWRHQTPVRGYLLLGKRWDDAWIGQLSTLIGARLTIHSLDEPPHPQAPLHEFHHPIAGLDGQPLALLEARFNFELLEAARQAFIRGVVLLSIVAILAVAVFVGIVALLVLRPLHQLTRSLETRQTAPIARLLSSKTEFGEIARLLAGQLRWGQMLQDEMRRQLDRTNPEFARRDAEANEALRIRLAGNIHDGPIQSIYAAGLQLAAVQSEAARGRSPSPAQIANITGLLQQTSADLRNLILELEPEELRERDLETALQQIERHFQQIARATFELEIAEGTLDGLSRDAQTHLYFICRELTSNALRHARPTHASLHLRLDRGFLQLEWFNNGVPARTEAPVRPPGNGLRNIERRVAELGGTVRSGPEGGGWRMFCEMPLTSLITAATLPRLTN